MLKQLCQKKKSKYIIFIVISICLGVGFLMFLDSIIVKNKFGMQVEPEKVEILDAAYLKPFGKDGYVKSATYFGDEWPINFWNSEMDNLQADMQQIKADGFNSIILVIPWREFQPETKPIIYNEYAFENLEKVMQAAAEEMLDVYVRIGYTWDFYEDENKNISHRFQLLMGDANVQTAWYDYVSKIRVTLEPFNNFAGAFLTWEDFWNLLGMCDETVEIVRREKAKFIGYQAWVKANYSLEEYNIKFGTNYSKYSKIPIPHRSEPAMEDMYAFYDNFLNTILRNSQNVLPNLSMEVRMDWDVVNKSDGQTDYYKHYSTFGCENSNYTTTMYGIPMGFENVGERVTYSEALEKTKYILEQLKLNNDGKAVYIDQFIFADNTPKFKNNAQMKEEDMNLYLENVADVLTEYSEGYGIWTYRNYCANMIYNSQFALAGEGWEYSSSVLFEEINDSTVCKLTDESHIKQNISGIRNHFDADEYIFEISVMEVEQPCEITVSMGEEQKELQISDTGEYTLTFDKGRSFDIVLEVESGEVAVDNVKLYSQIQQGFLYDENNNELECITGIRSLNSKLE